MLLPVFKRHFSLLNFCAAYFEPQLNSARIRSDRIGSDRLTSSSLHTLVALALTLTLTLALRCAGFARLGLARAPPTPPPPALPLSDNGPIHYCACLASFAAHFIKMAFKTIIQALKLYLHSLQSLFNLLLLLRFEVAPPSPLPHPLAPCLHHLWLLRPIETVPKRAQLRFMSRKTLMALQKRDLSLSLPLALEQLNLVMIHPEVYGISPKKTEP